MNKKTLVILIVVVAIVIILCISLKGCGQNEVKSDESVSSVASVSVEEDFQDEQTAEEKGTDEVIPVDLEEVENVVDENTEDEKIEVDNEEVKDTGNTGSVDKSGSSKNNSTSNKSNNSNKNSTNNSSTSNANNSSSNNSNVNVNVTINNTNDNSNKNSSTNNNSSNSSSNSSSTVVEHTHSWVKSVKVIHHEEEGEYQKVLVKDAWTEEIPVYKKVTRAICNGCGEDITENIDDHLRTEMLKGNFACGGYHTESRKVQTGTETVEHPAEYENKWVVTKEAWDEEVISYKCSCGATK